MKRYFVIATVAILAGFAYIGTTYAVGQRCAKTSDCFSGEVCVKKTRTCEEEAR